MFKENRLSNNNLFTRKFATGFTLIEVMLAMAIFAIAGTAILGAADTNLRALSKLEQNTIANWVVSNQLVEATLNKQWPPRNNKQGQVELAGIEWFWQQKVIKTTDKNMRALVMEVRLNEKDKNPLAFMMTYVVKQKP
ncbi:MAG: type II secretion system minor pseudopilin GspI [Alteromonadaceae bacterium]|nr:type II secretion system minor pseudopilin GspI [Alteromonadaceae bacterium]